MERISVVIATRNRSVLLARTLESLCGQTWPRDRYEIIVADNGSTDDTAAVVAAASSAAGGAPRVRYLLVPEPGKSHAVNAALAVAEADLVALTDDDVLPDPAWLERLAAAVIETGADFVAGRIQPLWEVPPPAWVSESLHGVLAVPDNGPVRLMIDQSRSGVMPIGANMAVTRAVVSRIGGLRTDLGKLEGSLRTGEDHEFFLRMLGAGFRGVYEPTALVHHFVPAARLERRYFRRWLYQNGKDVAQVERAYPTPLRRMFGVPGYLWRNAVRDARRAVAASVQGNAAARFAAETRLLWLAGYVGETWAGRRNTAAAG